MPYKLTLNYEEAALLVTILTDKAKELWAWQLATGSDAREETYLGILELMKKLHIEQER